MKLYLIALLLFALCIPYASLSAQSTVATAADSTPLYLYRKNPAQKIAATPCGEIRINYCMQDDDSLSACPQVYYGRYKKRTADSIWLDVYQFEETRVDTNLRTVINTSGFVDGDSYIKPFRIDNITVFKYNSLRRQNYNNVFKSLVGLSGFNMLLIAPLASINYKEGRFNGARYFRWVGWSAVGLACSFSLNLATGARRYTIAPMAK